jgi:hypothetical protein
MALWASRISSKVASHSAVSGLRTAATFCSPTARRRVEVSLRVEVLNAKGDYVRQGRGMSVHGSLSHANLIIFSASITRFES